MMDNVKDITIVIKWSGKEYPITDLTEHDTVAILKHEICNKTQVRPERQKLLNLKYKGKFAPDDVKLGALELKPNFKVMMVGSLEADIEEVCIRPDEADDVINDLDIEDEETSVENTEVYLAKIRKRIRQYNIVLLNPPREGKKLLVLDVDYTLFDHKSVAETGAELMRPYLHEFLTSAYINYDIVIWSATGMIWIEEKMKILGVTTHPEYKIMFYLDHKARIGVHTTKHGVINVKPLGLIWAKFPQYDSKNTIMFDDVRRNFLMNPKCGLKIRPFREAHLNRHKDNELLKLIKYLKNIAESCNDFNQLNHRKWESYNPKKKH